MSHELSDNWGWRSAACLGADQDARAGRNSFVDLFFGDSDANLSPEERIAKKWKKDNHVKHHHKHAETTAELNILRQFVAFVPRKVLPQLPEMDLAVPRCMTLQGVVSFLDVAGFTKLTERLAMQPDGAERLAKIINKLMGQMLNTCPTGDVIKFSGDAILVLYEPDRTFMPEDTPPASKKRGNNPYDDMPAMKNAAYRAVSEGLNALHDDYTVTPEELGAFSSDPNDPVSVHGIKLALHVAITAGNLQLMHVGGVFGRWEVVMAGEAMHTLGATADNAPTDHLCVEKNCYELLEGDPTGLKFEGERLAPPNEDYVRILSEIGANSMGLGTIFNPLTDAVGGLVSTIVGDSSHQGLGLRLVEGYSEDELNILRRYVSPVIQRAIKAKTMEAVSCFTDVTVMFVGISGVDLGLYNPEVDMIMGQVIMSTVQDCVYDHEGSVNKFVMDDKGALLLCAWGLPPMAHVDDPHRATASAMELAAALQDLGIQAHVGVTTGKVFAGVIGPPHRCEYSLLGDTVNLSARLMCKAPFGGVLTDHGTYTSAVATGIEFEVLEPIKVKGKDNIVKIYKPLKDNHATDNEKKGGHPALNKALWGKGDGFESGARLLSQGHMRTREREELFEILDSLYVGGGGVLLLSGDAGSGKSELAKMCTSSTEQFGSRLIQSLTPKNQAKMSDIAAKPCSELSQIMRGLLTRESEMQVGSVVPEGRPSTVFEWDARLKEMLNDPSLAGKTSLFNDYFEEWVAMDAKVEAAVGEDEASDTNKKAPDIKEKLRAKSSVLEKEKPAEDQGSKPMDAAMRLKMLSSVLDKLLTTTRPIMIFIHVRTGSSLAGGVHPEMWAVLRHLSEYGLKCYNNEIPNAHAFVVALTHRRVLDFGGGRTMNPDYAKVIANAEACSGMLQLDPLDTADREKYLCLSLKASKVPLAVSRWVSDVANGNPQYIEICAKHLESESIVTLGSKEEAVLGSVLPQAVFTANGQASLKTLEVPAKIMGFVKTTLGSLGPQDKLLVQVLSLFRLEEDNKQPLPTMHVVHRAYLAIAEIDYDDLVPVIDRLALYGLVSIFNGLENNEAHQIDSRSSNVEEDTVHRASFYYLLTYPLLQNQASEQLLANQKNAILKTMEPKSAE